MRASRADVCQIGSQGFLSRPQGSKSKLAIAFAIEDAITGPRSATGESAVGYADSYRLNFGNVPHPPSFLTIRRRAIRHGMSLALGPAVAGMQGFLAGARDEQGARAVTCSDGFVAVAHERHEIVLLRCRVMDHHLLPGRHHLG
jgi:hypothetical protein